MSKLDEMDERERQLLIEKVAGRLPACYHSCEQLRKALKDQIEISKFLILEREKLQRLCSSLAEVLVIFNENDQYTEAMGNLVDEGRKAAGEKA